MEKSCLPCELLAKVGERKRKGTTNGLDNLAGVVNNGDCLFERHVGQRCGISSPALSRKGATR